MYLDPVDLVPFATIPEAKASAMIADAEAMAASVAPCLVGGDPMTPEQVAAVRAILRRAVLRWHETGTGMVTQQSAGPFQQSIDTTRSAPRGLFWPSEIAELQGICQQVTGATKATKVFTVATGRRFAPVHAAICDLNLGGSTCSCGSYLNRLEGPIPEYGELY